MLDEVKPDVLRRILRWCVDPKPENRPTAKELIKQFQLILDTKIVFIGSENFQNHC